MQEDTDRVVVDIEEMVAKLSNPTQYNFKIFKVGHHLRQVKAEDYEPKIVAIGPYHRGKEHLQNMEKHKVRFLQQLLQRRSDLSIHKLVKKLREMEEYALECYPNLNLGNINMDEFVRTLLLDGCFVIELLRKYFDYYNGISRDTDPILKSETLSQIVHDLMLLENQLPFPILNMLFVMTNFVVEPQDIGTLVLCLVTNIFQWSSRHHACYVLEPWENNFFTTDHLLGFVYRLYYPFIDEGKVEKGKNSCININSASELTEAGIRLQWCTQDRLIFEDGVLNLPYRQVTVKTESLVRNLMAYEQLCLDDDHHKHVTGYVFLMHSLIRSTKDAEILRQKMIISNFLGGDAKVYQMFDQLVTNFLWSPFYASFDVYETLNVHCRRRRVKWMAKLWTDYFNSPWSLIKFLAAVLLLVITIVELAISIETFKHSEDVVKVHIV